MFLAVTEVELGEYLLNTDHISGIEKSIGGKTIINFATEFVQRQYKQTGKNFIITAKFEDMEEWLDERKFLL
jgi:chitinase